MRHIFSGLRIHSTAVPPYDMFRPSHVVVGYISSSSYNLHIRAEIMRVFVFVVFVDGLQYSAPQVRRERTVVARQTGWVGFRFFSRFFMLCMFGLLFSSTLVLTEYSSPFLPGDYGSNCEITRQLAPTWCKLKYSH